MGAEVLGTPLTLEQLSDFLHAQPGVVLVGGQALAFWADYYDALGTGYESGLTRDLDFFGTRDQARIHALALQARFPERVTFQMATLDTPPPSTAVIFVEDIDGQLEPLVIDYISAMAGYQYETERRMLERAPQVHVAGVPIHAMHPFDCLKSRIHNLALIPRKRSELGIEQAQTSIRVVRAMLGDDCAAGWNRERSTALRTAEAIIELALHRHEWKLDTCMASMSWGPSPLRRSATASRTPAGPRRAGTWMRASRAATPGCLRSQVADV